MATLQDIFNLAKADGGKFFVIDEAGEPKLVIMSVEEYERMLFGKIKHTVDEVEKINKEIIRAQLTEEITPPPVVTASSIDLPIQKPLPVKNGSVDLREEVIDPSFDFEGPKVNLEDI